MIDRFDAIGRAIRSRIAQPDAGKGRQRQCVELALPVRACPLRNGRVARGELDGAGRFVVRASDPRNRGAGDVAGRRGRRVVELAGGHVPDELFALRENAAVTFGTPEKTPSTATAPLPVVAAMSVNAMPMVWPITTTSPAAMAEPLLA